MAEVARPARERRRPAARRPQLSRSRLRRHLTPLLFLAPFLLLFGVFLIAPLAYALRMGLYADRLVGGQVFVGADNFVRAIHDGFFHEGLRHMGLFGLVQIPVMIGLALVFALLIDGRAVFAPGLFRLAFFVPFAVPTVVAALMWGYLYGPSLGPFAQLADDLGLPEPGFLTASGMLPSLGNIVTWEWTGYNMIILYAALKAIPVELREAAAVDGADDWRIARDIRIPLIAPAIVLTVVFSIIGTLQLFNEPQIMNAIAPDVIGTHYTPNLYAYNTAFTAQQFNYAAALSFVLGAVVFVGSYAFMLATSRRGRQ
jgi:multiple sugar transport system permease protein